MMAKAQLQGSRCINTNFLATNLFSWHTNILDTKRNISLDLVNGNFEALWLNQKLQSENGRRVK